MLDHTQVIINLKSEFWNLIRLICMATLNMLNASYLRIKWLNVLIIVLNERRLLQRRADGIPKMYLLNLEIELLCENWFN